MKSRSNHLRWFLKDAERSHQSKSSTMICFDVNAHAWICELHEGEKGFPAFKEDAGPYIFLKDVNSCNLKIGLRLIHAMFRLSLKRRWPSNVSAFRRTPSALLLSETSASFWKTSVSEGRQKAETRVFQRLSQSVPLAIFFNEKAETWISFYERRWFNVFHKRGRLLKDSDVLRWHSNARLL
jgi:hypothetical protein